MVFSLPSFPTQNSNHPTVLVSLVFGPNPAIPPVGTATAVPADGPTFASVSSLVIENALNLTNDIPLFLRRVPAIAEMKVLIVPPVLIPSKLVLVVIVSTRLVPPTMKTTNHQTQYKSPIKTSDKHTSLKPETK